VGENDLLRPLPYDHTGNLAGWRLRIRIPDLSGRRDIARETLRDWQRQAKRIFVPGRDGEVSQGFSMFDGANTVSPKRRARQTIASSGLFSDAGNSKRRGFGRTFLTPEEDKGRAARECGAGISPRSYSAATDSLARIRTVVGSVDRAGGQQVRIDGVSAWPPFRIYSVRLNCGLPIARITGGTLDDQPTNTGVAPIARLLAPGSYQRQASRRPKWKTLNGAGKRGSHPDSHQGVWARK
jgi:hypothetical protein